MRAAFFALCLALSSIVLLPATATAQAFKCVDPATGHVTLSGGGCPPGSESTFLDVKSANRMDSTRYQPKPWEEFQTERAVQRPRVAIIGEGQPTRHRNSGIDCREAMRPIPGSRGVTAAQRSACSGGRLESHESWSISAPIPGPAAAPRVITSCDAGGCWDNQGSRYHRGAGNTMFPSVGGSACQYINGQMFCP